MANGVNGVGGSLSKKSTGTVSVDDFARTLVDLAIGHAQTFLCPFCKGHVPVTQKHTNWYHKDVLGRDLGHEGAASNLRNMDIDEITSLILGQLQSES